MEKFSRRSFLSDAASALLNDKGQLPETEYKDPSNKTLPDDLTLTSTGLNEYAGAWTETQVMHLVRRCLFGVTKDDIAFFKAKTMSEAVDYLLTIPATPPSPPLNHYGSVVNDPEVPVGQTWINAAANGNLEGARRQSLKAWWLGLCVNQERNLREKMTLFWHNHFATESNIVQDSRYLYKHHALLRANCLGNFKDLVKQITIDPAMLVYLNGEDNTKTAPDENYGRELQELFTVGKDLAQHYTEDDVKAAARVLTGWRNNRTGINSYFDSTRHDTTNKQFSSFYNNTTITGRSGTNAGMDELNDLMNMIFAQEEVSKYICRKIYRYFIYYIIDESIELQVIEPLAAHFRTTNYDIKAVMAKLLKSEHFYDALNMGCVIKQPVDFVAGCARLMNLQYPGPSNVQQQYSHWLYTQQYTAVIGQDLGDPPNVAGWPAYYEDPQYYELWINSDSLPKRNLLNDAMLYTGYNRFGFKLIYDVIAFADQFGTPSDPDLLLNDILALCHPVSLSQTSKDSIKVSFLLSGQSSNHYWTDAWNTYKNNPSDTTAKATVTTRLQAMMKYIFGLAEFQLS